MYWLTSFCLQNRTMLECKGKVVLICELLGPLCILSSALKLQSSDAVTVLELLCQQDGSNVSTQRLELALALFREVRLMECFEGEYIICVCVPTVEMACCLPFIHTW